MYRACFWRASKFAERAGGVGRGGEGVVGETGGVMVGDDSKEESAVSDSG